jgi:hypothetical protein
MFFVPNTTGLTKHIQVRAETSAHPEAGDDAALDEDARWQRSLLRLPDLNQGKDDKQRKGEHKQRDNTSLAPLDTISSYWPEAREREKGVGGSP